MNPVPPRIRIRSLSEGAPAMGKPNPNRLSPRPKPAPLAATSRRKSRLEVIHLPRQVRCGSYYATRILTTRHEVTRRAKTGEVVACGEPLGVSALPAQTG